MDFQLNSQISDSSPSSSISPPSKHPPLPTTTTNTTAHQSTTPCILDGNPSPKLVIASTSSPPTSPPLTTPPLMLLSPPSPTPTALRSFAWARSDNSCPKMAGYEFRLAIAVPSPLWGQYFSISSSLPLPPAPVMTLFVAGCTTDIRRILLKLVMGIWRVFYEEMENLGIGDGCELRPKGARIPVPWELLQPVTRILGHCLLGPLNAEDVKMLLQWMYARASHELNLQAILATRSLIQLNKRGREAAKVPASCCQQLLCQMLTRRKLKSRRSFWFPNNCSVSDGLTGFHQCPACEC